MARLHILKGFSDLESALWVHKHHPGLTIRQMVRTARENGYEVTDTTKYDISQLLCEWGLVKKKNRALTQKGEAFYLLWQAKRDVAVDVLHGLQYSLWTVNRPAQNLASWAYKVICDHLWQSNAVPSDLDTLVIFLRKTCEKQPHIVSSGTGPAFSAKSVSNALDWLLGLTPPVLHGVSVTRGGKKSFRNAHFSRRSSCSTLLFVIAMAYVARESENPFQLGDEQRRAVCRFCLIEEPAFDSMTTDAIEKAPEYWQCGS